MLLGVILIAAATNLRDLARKDLAERLKIDAAKITVVSQKETVWPDGSLGCPQPGMSYTQVQTPGFMIELSAGGKTYMYHSDKRNVLYCETPGNLAPRKHSKSKLVPIVPRSR